MALGAIGASALVSGVGSLLGGAAGLIGTGKNIQQEYQNMANIAAGDIKKFYSQVESGKYDYKLPTEATDAYQMSKAKTSLDPLKRLEATKLSSLQGADSRALLTGLNPTLQQTAAGEMAAQEQQLQREIAGTQAYGQQKGDIAQANLDFRKQLGTRQLEQAETAQATALENKEALRRQRAESLASMIGGAGSAALGVVGEQQGWFGKNGGKFPGSYAAGGYVASRPQSRVSEIISSQFQNLANSIARPEEEDEDGEDNGKKVNGGMLRFNMGGNVLAQIMGGQGGIPPVQGPLPGEASHETNPIHMINDRGEKVGEAMGGEFVINDKQADVLMEAFNEVREAIEKEERKPTMDELMALYEANKQVFGQPQFNGGDEEMSA